MTYYPAYDSEYAEFLESAQYKKFIEDIKYQREQFKTSATILQSAIRTKLIELKKLN
jgi:hypothetical protein